MKLGVLFSGGKDSHLAAWIAKKEGHELTCLITLESKNKESYMFHTPSISSTKVQAEAMGIPLLKVLTRGEKEEELNDLTKAIKKAKSDYAIKGIVTGAVESVYQSSRIQKICLELGLICFNPLWQRNPEELLKELIEEGFEAIVVGVFAYPLEKNFLGKKIDEVFILEMKRLNKKYGIHIAGEGGEYESFVLFGPLYRKRLEVKSFKDFGSGHSYRRELTF